MMRTLIRRHKLINYAVVFSSLLIASQAAIAGESSAELHVDNLSDHQNFKPLVSSQPCTSNLSTTLPTTLSTSGRPKVRAQACLVKADAAVDAMAKGRLTIVDTRAADEFAKYRIPGALNMPAHTVKTKAFLKSQAFVLVDAGHTNADLESVCSDLRRHGYLKASVLQGGLSEWKARGGKFEGDVIASRALSIVPPAEFTQEQATKDWLVIDVRSHKNKEVAKSIPGAVTVPWLGNHKNDKALLAAINGAGSKRVLVIDDSGDSYVMIEALLRMKGKDVLYLDGGYRAYLKYQREQTAMWKQRDDPPKRKGCSA